MHAKGLKDVCHQYMTHMIEDLTCSINTHNAARCTRSSLSLYREPRTAQKSGSGRPNKISRMHSTFALRDVAATYTLHFTNCGTQTAVDKPHRTICSYHWQGSSLSTVFPAYGMGLHCQYRTVQPPGHRLNDAGLNAWQRQELFLFSTLSRPVTGLTYPPTQRVPSQGTSMQWQC
jgi:hypothetical protein